MSYERQPPMSRPAPRRSAATVSGLVLGLSTVTLAFGQFPLPTTPNSVMPHDCAVGWLGCPAESAAPSGDGFVCPPEELSWWPFLGVRLATPSGGINEYLGQPEVLDGRILEVEPAGRRRDGRPAAPVPWRASFTAKPDIRSICRSWAENRG